MAAELDPQVLSQLRKVGGERLLDELSDLFLTHAPRRLERIRKNLATGQLIDAEKAAHSLRSSCATLGARDLAALAGELESKLARQETDVAHLMEPIERAVGELVSRMEARRQRSLCECEAAE